MGVSGLGGQNGGRKRGTGPAGIQRVFCAVPDRAQRGCGPFWCHRAFWQRATGQSLPEATGAGTEAGAGVGWD